MTTLELITEPMASAPETPHDRYIRLFMPLADSLLRYAYTLTRNRSDAHDVTSEAMLRGYEQFPQLRNEAAFKAWMFTIVRRVFLQRVERGKRFEAFNPRTHDHAAHTPTPEASTEASTEAALLYAALDRLPREQRETIVLFELLDFSLEEIRAMQGGSLSGVKSRLVRGRAKLAHLLGAKNDR